MSWKSPKTVLGDKVEWDTSKIPGRRKKGTWSGKDDQLWRCRKTKRFEASLLTNLPRGACFVDAGAHFGDTVITMALHDRDALGRDDIRFVAFEPNPEKARWIEECASANGFGAESLRVICCVLGDETLVGGAKARRAEEKDWCKFDGRTSYELVEECSDDLQIPSNDATPHCDAHVQGESPTAPIGNARVEDDNVSCDSNSIKSSSSSSSSSTERFLDLRRLDDYFEVIHPIGFLHIDVEGWEAKVLSGASRLLTAVDVPGDGASNGPSRCYILAETFNQKEARRRGTGFSQTHEQDILDAMSKFPSFSRGEDVVDGERNMFFENRP